MRSEETQFRSSTGHSALSDRVKSPFCLSQMRKYSVEKTKRLKLIISIAK